MTYWKHASKHVVRCAACDSTRSRPVGNATAGSDAAYARGLPIKQKRTIITIIIMVGNKKHEKHLCRVLVRLIRQLELPVPMLGGRWRWNSSDTIIIIVFFGTRYIITRIILYRVYAIRLCVCYDPRPANGFPVRPSSITTCSYGITTPRFECNTLAVPTITRLYGAPTYLPVII